MGEESKEVIITYETLYDAVRKEKSRDDLQNLPKTFFTTILAYLREKQSSHDETKDKTDLFSSSEHEKLTVQLVNIRKILRELYDRREKKIVDIAINKSRTQSNIIDTSNMLMEEKTLYHALLTAFEDNRQNVLTRILHLQDPVIPFQLQETLPTSNAQEISDYKTKLVKFLQPIEQFVGKELELYGPFDTNDSAYLPADIASILVTKGSALEVEEE